MLRQKLPYKLGYLILMALIYIMSPTSVAHATNRCFTETGFCIDGRIREYWEENGGLPVFGFPIGPQESVIIDGKSITAQKFERNRLELHPENAKPYDVLLGRLGADRLVQQGRDWYAFAKDNQTSNCQFFAETNHSVCGSILKMWQSHGLTLDKNNSISYAESLGLFGLPLSGLVNETLSDGKTYQVQWFERARFEIHPENTAPYDVLLGLLGNEINQNTQTVTPVAQSPSRRSPLPNALIPSSKIEELGFSKSGLSPTGWHIWHEVANQIPGAEAATIESANNGWTTADRLQIFYVGQMYIKNGFTSGFPISINMLEYRDTASATQGLDTLLQYDKTENNYQLVDNYQVAGCQRQQWYKPGKGLARDTRLVILCNQYVTTYEIGSNPDYDHITESDIAQLFDMFIQHTIFGTR